MVPPSVRFSGGSSEIALRIRSRSSGMSSMRARISRVRDASGVRDRAGSTRPAPVPATAPSPTPRAVRRFRSRSWRAVVPCPGHRRVASAGPPAGWFRAAVAHGIEPRFDLGAVKRGTQQTLAQQPSAHPGRGLVEDADQGVAPSPANTGSSSSRLRTVTASSIMVSARS